MSEPELLEVVAAASETPFFLVIELDDKPESGHLGIDLDTPWLTTHADKLRLPATWWLIHKASGSAVMGLVVADGDQPYFTKHHVGNLMAGNEIIAYGLGKKAPDGTMTRVWLLPNGVVVGGDDVDTIAARIVNGVL